MSKAIVDREALLADFDMGFVLEKMTSEGRVPAAEFPEIVREFKRFLVLVLRERGPLAMIDRRVDELWHCFILFTPQYREFCTGVMGFFVDHQPRTSVTPVPPRAIANFVTAYQRHYGELPESWLTGFDTATKLEIKAGNPPQELTFDWSGWTGRPE